MSQEDRVNSPIGIFGGTFDPVHLGHMRPVLEVYETLGLGELRLIPAHVPPHRSTPQFTPELRLELLRRAAADVPGFVVDTRELERSGKSYMVDTLASLREEFPTRPLCLILGMDSFLSLPSWHRWEQLADYAHLVVMDRPGQAFTPEPKFGVWVQARRTATPEALHQEPAGRVYFQAVTQLSISATRIRALMAEGRSVRFLVPDPVWVALHERGLG